MRWLLTRLPAFERESYVDWYARCTRYQQAHPEFRFEVDAQLDSVGPYDLGHQRNHVDHVFAVAYDLTCSFSLIP